MTLRQVSLCHIFRKKAADIRRNIDHKHRVTEPQVYLSVYTISLTPHILLCDLRYFDYNCFSPP